MKILITDDEPQIVRILTLLLERAGYEVFSAYNGAEALTKLRTEQPDIAIVDMMMPRVTGLELLQAWQSQTHKSEDTQFIMLSALSDEDLQARLENFNNVQFMAKPFSPLQLLQTVQDMAAKHAPRQDVG